MDKENIKLEDMFLMGQQDMIYNTVKTFLKSKEAVKFNIIGINVKVENGYVNAEWKFGNRREGDIKDE